MEKFALDNDYVLPDGWKVDIAKDFQRNFDKIIIRCAESVTSKWLLLIEAITTHS
jgi:hypothetical protein